MRTIGHIIVHCSATQPTGWFAELPFAEQVAEIKRWHLERGWSDIGYHYLIGRNGAMLEGRPLAAKGAHCKGRNSNSVGICLIGGFGSSENDNPEDHFTPKQLDALRLLIASIKRKHTITRISGHNEHAAKACPGFNVPRWLEGKQDVAPKRDLMRPARKALVKGGPLGAVSGVGAGEALRATGGLDAVAQVVIIVAVAAVLVAWLFLREDDG